MIDLIKPTDGMILLGQFIRLYHGASSDLPVFRSNATGIWGDTPKYRFDTYGSLPINFKGWNAKHLGAGGACGETDDLTVLIVAIKDMNHRGLTAPICDTLWDECVAMGATITEDRHCEP